MKKICLFAVLVFALVLVACQPAAGVADQEEQQAGDVLAPSPTPPPSVWFIPNVDANCRIGPSVMHPILAVLTPGAEYQVYGINEDASLLFINTSLTQCWVKLTTGQANGDPGLLSQVAYGPVPTPIPDMAGAPGDGSSSGDSGGSGLVVDPGLIFTINPVFMVPLVFCGSYSNQTDCESHSCTWVPPHLNPCGTPGMCGFTPGYCTN